MLTFGLCVAAFMVFLSGAYFFNQAIDGRESSTRAWGVFFLLCDIGGLISLIVVIGQINPTPTP